MGSLIIASMVTRYWSILLLSAWLSTPSLSVQLSRVESTSQAVEFDDEDSTDTWLLPWISWSPTSQQKVREAEENLLEYVETESVGFFVNIGLVNGEKCQVWTRKFGSGGSEVPLVMIHGMGAGLAMFVLNLDSLARNRTIYAIDLPGFGRSSRISFPSIGTEIESQYTLMIERWRAILGIEKMNLLGHSFGGYLTGLYALQHSDYINLLVLADPWGMTEKPLDWKPRRKIPEWAKANRTRQYHTYLRLPLPLQCSRPYRGVSIPQFDERIWMASRPSSSTACWSG